MSGVFFDIASKSSRPKCKFYLITKSWPIEGYYEKKKRTDINGDEKFIVSRVKSVHLSIGVQRFGIIINHVQNQFSDISL